MTGRDTFASFFEVMSYDLGHFEGLAAVDPKPSHIETEAGFTPPNLMKKHMGREVPPVPYEVQDAFHGHYYCPSHSRYP
jgi:hypothetical protein